LVVIAEPVSTPEVSLRTSTAFRKSLAVGEVVKVEAFQISEDEMSEFERLASEVSPVEALRVAAVRYTPDFGSTTEVVTVTGAVHSQYARHEGRWLLDFERDAWLYKRDSDAVVNSLT
jgi:hypothetical protein